MIEGLGARIHLFVRPARRQGVTELFRDVLSCDVRELDFGLSHPILLVAFPDGSAFSVEFSELAAPEPSKPLDDDHAFRGAWIEFQSGDVSAVHAALDRANIPSFTHPGSTHRYFSAPGGQVFRIIDIGYRGP